MNGKRGRLERRTDGVLVEANRIQADLGQHTVAFGFQFAAQFAPVGFHFEGRRLGDVDALFLVAHQGNGFGQPRGDALQGCLEFPRAGREFAAGVGRRVISEEIETEGLGQQLAVGVAR